MASELLRSTSAAADACRRRRRQRSPSTIVTNLADEPAERRARRKLRHDTARRAYDRPFALSFRSHVARVRARASSSVGVQRQTLSNGGDERRRRAPSAGLQAAGGARRVRTYLTRRRSAGVRGTYLRVAKQQILSHFLAQFHNSSSLVTATFRLYCIKRRYLRLQVSHIGIVSMLMVKFSDVVPIVRNRHPH